MFRQMYTFVFCIKLPQIDTLFVLNVNEASYIVTCAAWESDIESSVIL